MSRNSVLAALAVAALWPAAAGAQQTIDARRPAAADARIGIENSTGSIRVIGWSREEVAVKGQLGRGADSLELSGSPHRIQIEVVADDPHGVRSELEIHVPAGARLEIESFSADITVGDVSGDVRAESVNGSISIAGKPSVVQAETVGGSVEVKGASVRTHAESVNGPVTLGGVAGEVEANTVNGRLSVSGGVVERGQLETVSGDIHFDAELSGKGSLDVESVSGSVEVALAASEGAEFTVSTFNGRIVNELGPIPRSTSHPSAEKELEFTIGSGGARIEIKTLSGDVTLRKR